MLDKMDIAEPETNEAENLRNVEARSIKVREEKELCLKRLSSSWTNLNLSKRDLEVSSAKKPTASGETSARSASCSGNKRQKISDYFQKVSK